MNKDRVTEWMKEYASHIPSRELEAMQAAIKRAEWREVNNLHERTQTLAAYYRFHESAPCWQKAILPKGEL